MEAVVQFHNLLAAAGDKHEAPELLVLILVPLALSFALYRVSAAMVAKGSPRSFLWAAEVPLLFGAYLAYTPFYWIQRDSYRVLHSVTDRSVGLHYASFFIPCAATVLLAVWIVYSQHRERMER